MKHHDSLLKAEPDPVMQGIGARQERPLLWRDALRITLLHISASPALPGRPVHCITSSPPLLVEVLDPLPDVRDTASEQLGYLGMREEPSVYACWRGGTIAKRWCQMIFLNTGPLNHLWW